MEDYTIPENDEITDYDSMPVEYAEEYDGTDICEIAYFPKD